jgi:hypothetical protein
MLVERIEKDGIVSCLFKSSNILASEYNQASRDLVITFNAGRQYTYSNIDHKSYIRFEIAESQGSVFSKHIKKYQTKKNDDVDTSEKVNRLNEIINKKNEQPRQTI